MARHVLRWSAALLGVLVVAFATWVWRASPQEINPRIIGQAPGVLPAQELQNIPLRLHASETHTNPPHAPQVLTKLKPGMPRTSVESILGVSARQTHPVVVSDGKVTYQVIYETEGAPEPSAPQGLDLYPPGRKFVTLEFDATKPDHPLLTVHLSVQVS